MQGLPSELVGTESKGALWRHWDLRDPEGGSHGFMEREQNEQRKNRMRWEEDRWKWREKWEGLLIPENSLALLLLT